MIAMLSEDALNALPELTPENYTNRELSWIEFNNRVLKHAQDERVPLLERIKFLAIVSGNLDEFYMVRVASLRRKIEVGSGARRPDGYAPLALLDEIRARVIELMSTQRETLRYVTQLLKQQSVYLTQVSDLNTVQRAAVAAYFNDQVFPILTPLGVDHARPFPFISNLSLSLAVWLRREKDPDSEHEFVRIKVPDVIPRLVNVSEMVYRYAGQESEGSTFVWLEDVIADNLDSLFPGMTVVECSFFRVTRNADIDYEKEEASDLQEDISDIIEDSLLERRFGSVVRLSVPEDISQRTLGRLIEELKVDPERDVYKLNGALGIGHLMELMSLDRPDLKYVPFAPKIPDVLPSGKEPIFNAVRQRDVLLHHPFDSFLPVEEFIRGAAHDNDVQAIKATLYRVGRNSPIVQAMMEARDNDKQVAVLVEIKARFDEQNNLEWARAMDHKGVHVTYGVEELPVKTHAKIAMVVRREYDGIRRYVHLGTGNYNSGTARLYTDIGLFTCDREIGDDASRLFNRLTGYAPATTYKRLLVAPEYLLSSLVDLIDNEIAAAKEGKPARLIFKMNQLEEDVMIRKLFEASQAGVRVDLLVRGLCCLRPGIPGYSENIHVRSLVGRFLEHSRIFYFQNAPQEKQIFMGSADLMRRNLYNRVEIVFPVSEPIIQRRVLRILATYLRDNMQTWILQPDGTYQRVSPAEGEAQIDAQAIFIRDSAGLDELP